MKTNATHDGIRYHTNDNGCGLWKEVPLICPCSDDICRHAPQWRDMQIRGTADFTVNGIKSKRAKIIRELKR